MVLVDNENLLHCYRLSRVSWALAQISCIRLLLNIRLAIMRRQLLVSYGAGQTIIIIIFIVIIGLRYGDDKLFTDA